MGTNSEPEITHYNGQLRANHKMLGPKQYSNNVVATKRLKAAMTTLAMTEREADSASGVKDVDQTKER
eukprot:11178489-Karenia_brevis.AAC.1